jgi:alpha-beta hydrolase superfamily lysophospholipase
MTAKGPRALYFGSAGAPLFGWLHRSPGDNASDVGLVICNPFGFEEVCAHRSLKGLANATAAAGVTTLRFDYAGCGNSCSDDFEPQRLRAWVQSVHEAVELLKQIAGLDHVCLLGLRLGAAIAALAAVERADVHGLIAIAPVVGGRAYLRELRALDAVKRQVRTHGESGGDLLESAGFLMTGETSQLVGRLDLHALPKAPARRVLIVERDDIPGSDNWAGTVERLGAAATVVRWAGYVGMMDDPRRARVPEAIIAGVVDQLAKWTAKRGGRTIADDSAGARSALFRASTNSSEKMIREAIVEVDTGTSTLFGIATSEFEARQTESHAAGTGVLMLNAGSVHHIGPDRMWVQLARAWAMRGFVVLRLDISGIGDSPPRRGHAENEVYSPQAINDVALALEYMRDQLGVKRCHLLGLCSGAYHAFKAAAAGHAMASVIMINPLTFSWREGAVMDRELMENDVLEVASKYRSTLFTTGPWLKLLRGQLDFRIVIQVVYRRFADMLRDELRELMRLVGIRLGGDLAAELMATVNQGTSLRFVFAATSPGHALLRRQGGRIVKRLLDRGDLSIDLVPDADHTFTHLAARARLVSLLERLMFSDSQTRV